MLKPTKEEVLAATGKVVPDVIAPNLRVLFCGINPSLYSAAVGRHFARPGNRFWRTLHLAGFTDRVFSPDEDGQLPKLGLGITNVVERATVAAAEVSAVEFVEGGRRLEAKVRRFRPRCVAVLGITAYRTAFDRAKATPGRQSESLGDSMVWVLPNPSGLNAHYRVGDLAKLFRELRIAVET